MVNMPELCKKKLLTYMYYENTCWIFERSRNQNGYGHMKWDGILYPTHRLAWMLFKGEIPVGMNVLHICDNRACFNPDHLFLGTQADNVADMIAKGRMHSRNGSANSRATLSEQEVLEIREMLNEGKLSQREIGERFKVTQSTISNINVRKTWGHI